MAPLNAPPSLQLKDTHRKSVLPALPASHPDLTAVTQPVSVPTCVKLLQLASANLEVHSNAISELRTTVEQVQEVAQSLLARQQELEELMDQPLQMATMPPKTTLETKFPDESPILVHPYQRPQQEYVTLEHWLYQLQKHAWMLHEKTQKYTISPINVLNMVYRRRKLVEFTFQIRNAWVYLMLYLGMAIADKHTRLAQDANKNLNKLAVATGQTDYQDLDLDNAKQLFMQGEKYFLGYGVPRSFENAYKRYEAASKMGLPEALTMLGTMHEFGIGRNKNVSAAIGFYEKAAQKNHAEALCHLGRMYESGKGLEKSFKTAFDCYQKAAKTGHLEGLTQFGHMLEHGLGCEKDEKQAFQCFKQASDQQYSRAQNALGSCYYAGKGVKRDMFEAVALFKKASEQGHAPAEYNLGVCYEQGHGVIRDLTRAKIHYRNASELKHPMATCSLGYMLLLEGQIIDAINTFHLAVALENVEALYYLGTLYESGCEDTHGVVLNQDLDMALRYYQQAAHKGHIESLVRQASIMVCGPERIQNLQHATVCLKKAALPSNEFPKGHPEAQNMLGELYETGEGSELEEGPDIPKALGFYRQAVSQGNARAMFNLGSLHEQGVGCVKDLDRALKLYNESARLGNTDARQRLDELEAIGISLK
ncbi:hypothetical protein EDD86DRAFT_205691 [Gorgonomyces haynaldii]|nr:hypothetical protein EDD86DRAFT_205691 [Gorgonomyces haynaldii]